MPTSFYSGAGLDYLGALPNTGTFSSSLISNSTPGSSSFFDAPFSPWKITATTTSPYGPPTEFVIKTKKEELMDTKKLTVEERLNLLEEKTSQLTDRVDPLEQDYEYRKTVAAREREEKEFLRRVDHEVRRKLLERKTNKEWEYRKTPLSYALWDIGVPMLIGLFCSAGVGLILKKLGLVTFNF